MLNYDGSTSVKNPLGKLVWIVSDAVRSEKFCKHADDVFNLKWGPEKLQRFDDFLFFIIK